MFGDHLELHQSLDIYITLFSLMITLMWVDFVSLMISLRFYLSLSNLLLKLLPNIPPHLKFFAQTMYLNLFKIFFTPFVLILILFIKQFAYMPSNNMKLSNVNIITYLTSPTHYILRYMFYTTCDPIYSWLSLIFKITFFLLY